MLEPHAGRSSSNWIKSENSTFSVPYAKKLRKNNYGGRFIPVLASKRGQKRILRFFLVVREEGMRPTGVFRPGSGIILRVSNKLYLFAA